MLTIPDNLLVLRMFGNRFQDYLLCHLPRDQVQADSPVFSRIFLLALLEDKGDICFLLVLRHLS